MVEEYREFLESQLQTKRKQCENCFAPPREEGRCAGCNTIEEISELEEEISSYGEEL